jgi:hypothetical protein
MTAADAQITKKDRPNFLGMLIDLNIRLAFG